ncbi:MAG: NYN domain-containing protein [Anaerolineae bacterium]
MHYLIDGHNLIGKLPDISLDDPNDEVKLVFRLKSWAAGGRKRRVTVIFDGGLLGGVAWNLSSGPVKVLFAAQGQTADAWLIRRIRAAQNPAELTLISSDREVIAAANARRVPVLRSEEFAGRLASEPSRPQAQEDTEKALPETKADPRLTQSEVDEWMTMFGPAPEADSPPTRQRGKATPKPVPKPAPKPPKATRPRRRLRAVKSDDAQLTAAEIEEWMRLFGHETNT